MRYGSKFIFFGLSYPVTPALFAETLFVLNHLLYLYPESILTLYVKSFWIRYSVLLIDVFSY